MHVPHHCFAFTIRAGDCLTRFAPSTLKHGRCCQQTDAVRLALRHEDIQGLDRNFGVHPCKVSSMTTKLVPQGRSVRGPRHVFVAVDLPLEALRSFTNKALTTRHMLTP